MATAKLATSSARPGRGVGQGRAWRRGCALLILLPLAACERVIPEFINVTQVPVTLVYDGYNGIDRETLKPGARLDATSPADDMTTVRVFHANGRGFRMTDRWLARLHRQCGEVCELRIGEDDIIIHPKTFADKLGL